MQCPKCNHENPDNTKFCMECGGKLENVCPQCDAKLPAGAKFCMECGAKIDVATSTTTGPTIPRLEDMHAQLQNMIPEELAQKYVMAEQQATGENRPITALSADISGFTPLSESRIDIIGGAR